MKYKPVVLKMVIVYLCERNAHSNTNDWLQLCNIQNYQKKILQYSNGALILLNKFYLSHC